MHLTSINQEKKNDLSESASDKEEIYSLRNETVDQIKSVTQEKKIKPEIQTNFKIEGKILIDSFNKLLEVCSQNREMKLKYEIEKNVNLVSFEKNRIEISFNNQLDKNFVKDLSLKLFEWTNERWIITLSKTKGEISIKEKERIKKMELLNKSKDSDLYKNVLEKFSDASLIDVSLKKTKKE
jgi:DNA polymerase-3 subunit gamma/tau